MNQLIEGRKQAINNNQFVLSGRLYPLIDNGHGSLIENRDVSPEIKNYTNPVRIAEKQKSVKMTETGTDTYTFENVYVMFSDYETIVDVRLEFDYQGKTVKVEKREPKVKHDVTIGYEYELREITEVNIY